MKSQKKSNLIKRQRGVATVKDCKAAWERGLFKRIVYFPNNKKGFRLSDSFADVGMILALENLKWKLRELLELDYEKFLDKSELFYRLRDIESLLYFLEELLPYRFTFKAKTDFHGPHDETLFRLLRFIRKIVAFPNKVEAFYLEAEKIYRQNLKRNRDEESE